MDTHDRTEDAKLAGMANHVCVTTTTVAFALSQGMTMPEIEEATGLHGPSLGDPEARLPDDIAPRLWRAMIARHGKDVALTLEAARAAPFTTLGGLAHGIQYAATLGEALGFFVQNRRVLADRLEMEIVHSGDEVALRAQHPGDTIDSGRMSEVGMAITVRLFREILRARDALTRVELAYPPVGPIAAYEAFFRVPIGLDAPKNAIVFRAEALSNPVRGGSAELFAFVEAHFRLALERLDATRLPPNFVRLRRAIVEGATRGDYRASTVVGRAGLSLRTAQRIAAQQNTNLQAMIDAARAANAKAFLADPAISIETMAALLGYSDDRAFRRAFKRWTGATPSAYRRGVR